jgi:hypothetical protein
VAAPRCYKTWRERLGVLLLATPGAAIGFSSSVDSIDRTNTAGVSGSGRLRMNYEPSLVSAAAQRGFDAPHAHPARRPHCRVKKAAINGYFSPDRSRHSCRRSGRLSATASPTAEWMGISYLRISSGRPDATRIIDGSSVASIVPCIGLLRIG